MKKLVMAVAALGLCFKGVAQEKYVVAAATALKAQNFDEAKDDIDKAAANADTKDKPKTLFVKGETYIALQGVEKYKGMNPYREGAQALFKLLEIKPDYEKETVAGLMIAAFVYYYNDGINAYNNKKLTDASDYMKNVVKIHNIDFGKLMDEVPDMVKKKYDTISAEASQVIANSAYYNGQFGESIPLLTAVKNNPISRTPSVYACLIDALNKEKKTTEAKATIDEARKYYPDDATLRNYELNYFINSGQQDEMIKKLEEASAKDPKNPDLLFNIATTYLNMARPKTGPKPANQAELYSKAEDAFQRALAVAPDNELINYNCGSMYYNQGIDYNDQMNAITGTSDADQKKYDEAKAKRDALFVKSTPFFEKAYAGYSAKEKDLKAEDHNTYRAAVSALKELYARQGKTDKSAEMKKKLETL